jgi:hypothetical protein
MKGRTPALFILTADGMAALGVGRRRTGALRHLAPALVH